MLYPHPIAIPMKTLADAIAASAVSAATNHPIGIIKTASGFSAVIDVSDDRTRNLAALAIGTLIGFPKRKADLGLANSFARIGKTYRAKLLEKITTDELFNLTIKNAAGKLKASDIVVFAANLPDRVKPIEHFCSSLKQLASIRSYIIPVQLLEYAE
jgi:crotonobetainyl-CoA:carnitine CoA-transferase CaiB-like acyl-CoA transferase